MSLDQKLFLLDLENIFDAAGKKHFYNFSEAWRSMQKTHKTKFIYLVFMLNLSKPKGLGPVVA